MKKNLRLAYLVNGTAEILPFQTGFFQHVIATFPSEYIYKPDTLSEIYRILQTNGSLILLPYAWITGDKLTHRFLGWLFRSTGQTPSLDITKIVKSMNELFDEYGFVNDHELINCDKSMVLIFVATKK